MQEALTPALSHVREREAIVLLRDQCGPFRTPSEMITNVIVALSN